MLYAEGGVITTKSCGTKLGDLQEDNYYFGGATGGGVSDRYPQVPSYQTKAGITLKSVNDPPPRGAAFQMSPATPGLPRAIS